MYNFKKLALVSAMSGAFLAPTAVYAASPDAEVFLRVTDGAGAPTAAVAIAAELVPSTGAEIDLADFAGVARAISVLFADDGGVGDSGGAAALEATSPGTVFDVTFTVSNATFAQAVSVSDLALAPLGDPLDEISATIVSGGAEGESTVTYRVTVEDGAAGTGISAASSIDFTVPSLNVGNSDSDVGGSATITVTTTSGEDDVTEGAVDDNGGNTAAGNTSVDLITFVDGVAIGGVDGADDALIDVNDRDQLVDPNPLGANGTEAVLEAAGGAPNSNAEDALLLASLDITEGVARDLADNAFGIDTGEAGEGTVTISVSATGTAIADDDQIFLDRDGDDDLDTGTVDTLTVSNGVASITIDSVDFLADIGSGATFKLYFLPDAASELRPSTYTVTTTYAFDSTATTGDETDSSLATTEFDGLDLIDVHPNFVMNDASPDKSFIRVTSGSAGNNSVFINIFSVTGTDFGLVEFDTIGAKETEILDVADLQTVAPTYDAATDGNRAFVEVWTSGPAIVLPLTRTNDVLTNMSQSTLSNTADESGAGADASGLEDFD